MGPLQFFRRRTVGRPRPHDIIRRLAEDVNSLSSTAALAGEQQEQAQRAASEDIQKQLHVILEVFQELTSSQGGGDQSAEEAGELVAQFLAADLPHGLVEHLSDMDFEVRKDVISVFSMMLQGPQRLGTRVGATQQLLEYTRTQPRFFQLVVESYAKPEAATHCGMMLRSCVRHPQLVESFFAQPEVCTRLIEFTRHESFDVSSDAFSSLRDLLLTHKSIASAFLEANFREFFRPYNGLLQSADYVTQRQALKLLSEMLLDRTFMRVMLTYIGDEQFLQIHMNLLREDSKVIQVEAFHVFKIFVANPQKPPRVQQILFKNKERLVKLLEGLRPNKPNRQDDKQFLEDRKTVVEKLQVL